MCAADGSTPHSLRRTSKVSQVRGDDAPQDCSKTTEESNRSLCGQHMPGSSCSSAVLADIAAHSAAYLQSSF